MKSFCPLLSGTSGLPNDVSCSPRSGSQVDPPPTGVTGLRGIFRQLVLQASIQSYRVLQKDQFQRLPFL